MRRNYPKTKSTSTSKDYIELAVRVKISAQVVGFGGTWRKAKDRGKFAEIQGRIGNGRI